MVYMNFSVWCWENKQITAETKLATVSNKDARIYLHWFQDEANKITKRKHFQLWNMYSRLSFSRYNERTKPLSLNALAHCVETQPSIKLILILLFCSPLWFLIHKLNSEYQISVCTAPYVCWGISRKLEDSLSSVFLIDSSPPSDPNSCSISSIWIWVEPWTPHCPY